jgi:CheY-like chemotaxis protein
VIRLLLADDHALVREGLKRILAAAADIEVAGEAANGDEALALVKQLDFDLALVDLSMPGLSGLDLVKRLRLEKPKLRILVLSMHGESQYAARALKAGSARSPVAACTSARLRPPNCSAPLLPPATRRRTPRFPIASSRYSASSSRAAASPRSPRRSTCR